MQSSPTEVSQATEPSPSDKRPSVWEKPIAVTLLSLIFPGLGQVINREPRKGLVFAASGPLIAFFGGRSGLFLTFRGFACLIILGIGWHLWIAVDAFRVARRRISVSDFPSYSTGALGLYGGLVLAITIYASTDSFLRMAINIKAFKTSTDSFCPTLCTGERLIVNLNAFTTDQPKRGNVIAFDFHGQHGPVYVKRVAAVAGDVVSERNGAVFVNGEAYAPSVATRNCGQAPKPTTIADDKPRFSPVTVPSTSFFVIGDNFTNSFDSRIEGFGFVTPDQIVGKAIYIYWSPEKTRIGCAIE